ncbi:glycerophosphoryl diester phosphodiesterase membrane domain-containing protein [Kitasatospora sp. NPDC091207]|uniref:glycerophosphoryl diester phosphodiesterase membrane domain-containing protein n=1 Tax=Kitasatospora sp. NPDC091207 TaxID=3364083 RepID=UPI003814B587
MTDTPGWASPSSSEPPRDDTRPPADTSAAVPGQSVPPHAVPTAPPAWGAGYGGPGKGGPPYGGHGPQGPYGQPGWGVPASPKPGIIPLRPLGLGEILDGAVSTIRKHWRTTLGLSLGVAVVEQAAVTGTQLAVKGDTGDLTPVLSALVSLPVTMLLSVVAAALLTMVVSRAILGQSATVRDAWRDARPRLLQLTGLTLLTGLIGAGIVLLGFAPMIGYLLAGADEPAIAALLFVVGLLSVPAAIWIWIQLSLAAPALMLEKQGVRTALSRSRRLVRGSWWRIFGINILSQLMAGIVAGIISVPFTVVGLVLGFDDLTGQVDAGDPATLPTAVLITTAIAGVIASTLTIPFTATIGVLLYVDQRIRREALDIELARAAGLPEYGGTGWGDQTGPNPARL